MQIAELRRTNAQNAATVASLKQLVDTVPQVEADIARLNRDYEVTRAQYLALVQRLETAKMSENADQTGTIRFQVIDPPAVPLRPVAPMRSMLFSGVLLFGLIAGIGAAILLDMARPVFHTARGLSEIVGLPVIGSVTRMWANQYKSLRRRDLLGFCGGVTCLLLAFGGVNFFGERAIQVIFGLNG